MFGMVLHLILVDGSVVVGTSSVMMEDNSPEKRRKIDVANPIAGEMGAILSAVVYSMAFFGEQTGIVYASSLSACFDTALSVLVA